MKRIFWFVTCLMLLPHLASGIPKLDRPVTDLTGVLNDADITALDGQIRNLRSEVGTQMAVLIVDSTDGVPIEDYAHQVAETWGGGSEANDNGVLFVLALKDRRMRLEVGAGLEAFIPDSKAIQFTGAIKSSLKQKDYAGGLATMIRKVKTASRGAPNEPGNASTKKDKDVSPLLFIHLVAVFFGFVLGLIAYLGGGTMSTYVSITFVAVILATFAFGQPGASFVGAVLGHMISYALVFVSLISPLRRDPPTYINRGLGALMLPYGFCIPFIGMSFAVASKVDALATSGYAIMTHAFSTWFAAVFSAIIFWLPTFLCWKIVDLIRGIKLPSANGGRSGATHAGHTFSSSTSSTWTSGWSDSSDYSSSFDSGWDGGGGDFDGGGASDDW